MLCINSVNKAQTCINHVFMNRQLPVLDDLLMMGGGKERA